ncbi:MAG TPA: AAA family ATPase [Burkholderiaceae bacterium]|nr:AAA family ATPase [Burkholderiaceae bacterium]
MPVIAIVNRKGGSGKSTLATHLAAWCAHQGMPVLLGDADFQQSSHAWLRQRDLQKLAPAPKIVGWSVDPRNILRTPPGVTHVILDTPGGLKGYDLLRVVMLADVVLMPLCHSLFDRESAAECYTELLAHPRVARGRCKIAAVGMRIDARTKAEASLRQWAEGLQLPFLGALRETQTYVKCLEYGLTIFDMPAAKVEGDLAQWRSIIEFVTPVLHAAPEPEAKPAASVLPRPAAKPAPGVLPKPEVKPAASVLPKPAAKPAVHKPSRPVLPPGSLPSGNLRPLGVSAEAELTAARTGPGALDPLPAETTETRVAVNGSHVNGTPVNGSAVNGHPGNGHDHGAPAEPAPEATKVRRLVPVSPAEELDSHFGGLTTRIGRWLESLSVKRAR